MTLTFCSERVFVVAARLSLPLRRAWAVTRAEHASTTGITKNHSRRFPLVIGSSCILWSQVLGFFLTTRHGEDDWNEEESRDRGKEQPANDRAAEWRILFPSLAEP